MSNRARVTALFCLLVMACLAIGCPKGVTISKIVADPSRYEKDEVAVKGTVVSSWGALREGAYEIDDGTGKMWVICQGRAVPGKGSRVVAIGRVLPTFTIAGRSFATVLRESDRKY